MEQKKQKLGITSQGQLQIELAKQGVTLDRMQQAFNEHQLAQYYVMQKVGNIPKFSRKELLEQYYAQQEDFAVKGKVKWRQIMISFEKNQGEVPATHKMEVVTKKLIEGADFAELAKEYSEDSTASEGGLWDWTEMGNLSDENMEAVLFQLPLGTVSDVIRTDYGLLIVKVVERIDPGYLSFADVHDQISAKLREKRFQATSRKLVEELMQNAVIESKYDLGPAVPNRTADPYAMESQVDIQ